MSKPKEVSQLFTRADELNQKTRAAFQEGNQDEFEKSVLEAIEIYRKILILSPETGEAYYWLGNKYYEIRKQVVV